MKFLTVVTLSLSFLSLSFPARAESLEFLSKSPLLKAAKLNIAPVELKDGKVLLQVIWEKPEAGALLGDDGKLHELVIADANKTYKTSVQMCGEPHLVPARTPKDGAAPSGRFLVLGKIPSGFSVSWTPAVETQEALPPKCKAPKKGFTRNSHSTAKIAGLDGSFFHALYDSASLQKRQKELAGKLDEKCLRETWQVQRLGGINHGRCSVLLDDPMNCEGTGSYQGVLGKPLGMITLAKGKAREQWLVFGAKGYEGTAYLGVKLGKQRPVQKKDLHFYVFSGC